METFATGMILWLSSGKVQLVVFLGSFGALYLFYYTLQLIRVKTACLGLVFVHGCRSATEIDGRLAEKSTMCVFVFLFSVFTCIYRNVCRAVKVAKIIKCFLLACEWMLWISIYRERDVKCIYLLIKCTYTYSIYSMDGRVCVIM